MSEFAGRWIPDPDQWRCDRCGKPTYGLCGAVASNGSFSHFSDEACKQDAAVDYRLAFSIAHQRLLELSRFAWDSFTELSDEQWDALPNEVRESLTGFYSYAQDATEASFYDPAAESDSGAGS